jgi:hypothetical protein
MLCVSEKLQNLHKLAIAAIDNPTDENFKFFREECLPAEIAALIIIASKQN